jgi:hypothetical protein
LIFLRVADQILDTSDAILIQPGKIFMDDFLARMGPGISDWVDFIESVYLYEPTPKEVFDSSDHIRTMTTDLYKSKENEDDPVATNRKWYNLEALDYFRILNLSKDIPKDTLVMAPLSSEMKLLWDMVNNLDKVKTSFGPVDKNNFLEFKDNMIRLESEVKAFYYENYLANKSRENIKGDYDTVSLITAMTEWMDNKLDVKRFKYWLMTRHNIFGSCVIKEMGLEGDQNFDVDMREKFGYTGTCCNMTPDFCYEENDKVYLIDFAVTSVDPGRIRDMKVSKYEELRIGLSSFLRKEVVVDAAVWKINDDNNYQIPEFMEMARKKLETNKDMKTVREIQTTVSQMDNYEMLRSNFDELMDDPEAMLKRLTSYKALNLSLVRFYNFSDSKAVDTEDSRINMKPSMKKMVTMKESKYLKDLEEASSVNYKDYFKEVETSLNTIIETGRIPNYLKECSITDKEMLREKAESILMEETNKRKRFLANPNFKMKHPFKLPFMKFYSDSMEEYCGTTTPSYWAQDLELADGTILISHKSTLELPMNDDNKILEEYNMEGIGIDQEDDEALVDSMLEFFKEESGYLMDEINFFKGLEVREDIQKFSESNLFMQIDFWANVLENLSYLEGRRHILNHRRGNSVFKNFGKYMLIMKEGSKLSAEKQIRFKIVIHKDDMLDERGYLAQKWIEFEEDNELVSTKWLTMSITDFRHFLKIREVSISMISDYNDKKMEMLKTDTLMWETLEKSLMVQLIFLMENKRGTSTTAQLNRYLMHSAYGYLTNRFRLLEDIFSEPCRSQIEAYLRVRQIKWFLYQAPRASEHWDTRIKHMHSTATDYDRVVMPSFFDFDCNIEFGMMMNEIYLGNLFDKEAGFLDHRIKRIVSKMTKAEMMYQKVKMLDESKGIIKDRIKFWESDDMLHTFDSKFVASAMKFHFSNKINQVRFQEAMTEALTSVIDSAMMMTSSLKAGPYDSEVMEFKAKIYKTKSFLTIFEEVENLSTNMLSALVDQEPIKEAIFTIFPKSQIGGPREILIQSIKMRLFVKFLETFARRFSEKHPKEMITKDRRKAEIQSETMSEYKKTLEMLRKKGNMALMASMNMDASKWAPGFVMEHFMHLVYNWDIPVELKNILITCISSFSNKVVLTPEALKEKWRKKPSDQEEFDPSVEEFRKMNEENGGVVFLESGMGQGMFHLMSSLYHVIGDDAVDEIMTKYMRSRYNCTVKSNTMASSDDKTKILLFIFHNGDGIEAEKAMQSYVYGVDLLYRLMNIHTNWKKSALHLTICEFNSLFSIGKRMCWAGIKDLYMANSIPDLTCPEEACMFILGNMRRCLEHGVYLPTIKIMMQMARNQLIRYYRLDEKLIYKLKTILECEEDNLPYQLGFLPCDMILETLVYGLEIHMFKHSDTSKLFQFYQGIYSAIKDKDSRRTRKVVPFSETSSGKFWYELPTRLDKRLKDLKKNFFENMMKKEPEELMGLVNMRALMTNSPETDFRHYMNRVSEYFIGMNRKYEFQETMVVHSLVRALQMSKGNGIIYPRQTKFEEAELTLREKKNKENEKDYQIISDLEEFMEEEKVDIEDFCTFILEQDTQNSSLKLLEGYKKLVEASKDIQMKLDLCTKNTKNTHPTMRTMRFYLSDISLNCSSSEILSFLFESEKDFRNSTLRCFDHLMRMSTTKMTMKEILRNPFLFIKNLMLQDDYSFKSFKDFLSYHNKSMRFVKITMLSENVCSGNAYENLLNLYKTRSNPAYILEDNNKFRLEEMDMIFLTNMSLGINHLEVDNKKEKVEEDKDLSIDSVDNAVVRCRKMYNATWNNLRDCVDFSYDRLEYKSYKVKGVQMKSWFDGMVLSRARENKDDMEVDMWILAREKVSLNQSEKIRSVLKRYFYEMSEKGFSIKIHTDDEEMDEDITYNLDLTMRMAIKIDYKYTYWRIFLVVAINRAPIENLKEVNIISLPDHFETFLMLRDSYSISSKSLNKFWLDEDMDINLENIMYDPPSIHKLDELFIKRGWLIKDLLPSGKEKMETFGMDAMKEFNESFGSVNMMNTISNLIGAVRLEDFSMEKYSEVKDWAEDMEEEEERAKNLTDMARILNESKSIMDNGNSGDSINLADRTSVTDIMDRAITESFRKEMVLEKYKLRRFYKIMEERGASHMFHNALLMEILLAYNHTLSDSMAVILYNIILKSNRDLYLLSPSLNLRKINSYKRLPENQRFLIKVEDMGNVDDWIMENDELMANI